MKSLDNLLRKAHICEENARALLKRGDGREELLLWLCEHANGMAEAVAADFAYRPSLPSVLREEAVRSANPSTEDASAFFHTALSFAYAAFLRDAFRKKGMGAERALALLGVGCAAPGGRVAYVRNPFTERAYRHFAKALSDPKVQYVGSFEEACGEVYGERADLALLPLFGKEGEWIRKTFRLVEKYELHVLRSVVLPIEGEDAACEFALVGRNLFLQSGGKAKCSLALVYYPTPGGESAPLCAAAYYGCGVRVSESGTGDYDRKFCRLLLEGGDWEAFLCWLLLSDCRFAIEGIFVSESEGAAGRFAKNKKEILS